MKTGIRAIHITAVLFSIFGLVLTLESRKLDYWSEYGPGPGFFPLGLGVIIFILAILILIGEVRNKDKAKAAEPFYGGWIRDRKPVLAITAFAFLMFTVKYLGFYLTSSLFIMFLTRVVEGKRWWVSLTVTAGAVIFFYFVFTHFLSVQLPTGFWGR